MSLSSSSNDLNITLVNPTTGQSEWLSLPANLPLSQVSELASAMFGLSSVRLFKDGQGLTGPTLQSSGIQTGDVLVVVPPGPAGPRVSSSSSTTTRRTAAPASAPAAAPGGLDFSSLLGGSATATSPAAALSTSNSSSSTDVPPVVYYPGMSVEEAMEYNPHPRNFITVLQTHDHLFKELRYHQPKLAAQLANQPLEKAVQIWRDEMVKGGIASALQQTQRYHQERAMQQRLQQNPNDDEAKSYFAKQERQKKVNQQYRQMMEEYPESLGRVLMLYVTAKINGYEIQAFCDSGAQMTIMSKRIAKLVGLEDYIDERFSGVAAGVGTGKILGRIHILQLQLGSSYYPCSVSVMDDPAPGATEMPFLLGLDMMKRHLVQLDLRKGVLRFSTSTEEIPFLHEKDLDTSQGGTKGFDAEQANQELQMIWEQEQPSKSNKDDDDEEEKKKMATKPDAPGAT